ncbi:hypothetical protein [Streptomyces sp. Ac-502]|uniref:hypothetical protein n=1 Tax=Streptomyces sp. Ac-502 TaxID=3342801 RepID=UPI0038626094
MPEPGSKDYDKRRARLRKDAENSGINDQQANEEGRRSRGPRTERGRGPKGERSGG